VTPSNACPPGAPQVLAAVAAVQAHEIPVPISDLPGLVYSPADGLFDPDGLMLVAVDPARLGVAPESLFSPAQDPAARPAINRHDILRAAGAALRGPDGRLQRRPLVLRANAGDCLRLAVLNGLPRALTDARGDALMPPIVPLNVDQRPGARADDLRPSARIALIIPTSHVTPGLDLPVPFGLNPGQAVGPQWAEPGGAQGANWYGLEVYAGRLVVGDGFDAAVRGIRFAVSADGMDAAFGLRNLNPRNATRCRTDGVAYDPVVIVGQRFCLAELATADRQRFLERFADTASAVRRAFRLEAARLLREREQRDDWEAAGVLHKIPYAFGPLPIKALGDPIGHGVHGLTGTVVVEPRGASYPNRPGDPAPDDPLVISRAPAEPTARIETADAAREVSDPQEPRRRVRFAEHVLLWQDGLNLWDRAKPAAPLRPDDPPVGGPIPNCRICDDSYDYGEKGVSYGSANFVQRLRGAPGVPPNLGARPQDEENGDGEDGGQDTIDFNRFVFPPRFLDPAFKPLPTPILRAAPEEEQFVRVLHPHGRARQRAYVPLGSDYEDIFLGFGSGHSALLAPGKGITAASCAPRTRGTYIWFDGAKHLFSGGTWGAMRVDGEADRRGRCEAPR
jgi:manganese oxidase